MTMTTASSDWRAPMMGVVDETRPGGPADAANVHRRVQGSRSSTSTTRCRRAPRSAGRCCAARACTRSHICRVAQGPRRRRPRRPGPRSRRPAAIGRAGRAGAAAPPERAARGRAGADEDRRWRSREKCTRSWSSSPRARTPSRSRSRDRRALRRPRGGDVDQAGVRAARPSPCHAATGAAGHRVLGPPAPRPAPAERADRGRTPARPGGAALARSTATWPPPRCGPGCSMTASTCARSPPCTGCLAIAGENRERRRQRTHPARRSPS